MLDELLEEISTLKKYKECFNIAIKEKQQMSDLLYEYMLKEYNSVNKSEWMSKYKTEWCNHCRHKDCCNIVLPDNINKPIPSDKAWIPGRIGCKNFKWD